MQVDIQALGFPLTAALREHTERRLRFALTRSGDRITRVSVRVGDTNGPRGGVDKFCRMRVAVDRTAPVVIEEVGADLYVVIDRAAERAGRNVAKCVVRAQESARAGSRWRADPPAAEA